MFQRKDLITLLNRFPSLRLGLFALLLGGGAATPAGFSADFRLGRDFSTDRNPNGVWTYGWAGEVLGPVHLLTVRRDSPADQGDVPSWQFTYDEAPVVYCNTNDQSITVGGGVAKMDPREVLFSGGQDGSEAKLAVIQFTAPTNGHYSVTTGVRPFYAGPPQGDADFHVIKNHQPLFTRFLGPCQSAAFTRSLKLKAGDTLKFQLGNGTDGLSYGSVYRIAIVIHLSRAGR